MKDAGKLTLAELEAIAARMESAARTIREAMAIVGQRPTESSNTLPPIRTDIVNIETPQTRPLANVETQERREYEIDRKAAQAAYLASMNPIRKAKLGQFARDGGSDLDAPIRQEPLTTISGD